MHIGVAIFPTTTSIRMAQLGQEAEARGIESIWLAEHSHIPVSRDTPFPGGGELPEMYYQTFDPFVALASAASATRTIKLATGICLVIQRDPIHLAKQVSSLDQVSDGRFLFGVGGGWNLEEMGNHGTPGDGRFKLLRERIEAMKEIWREEKAEYHGDLVDFDPIFQWPKPVQTPHPPIHVGGAFPGGAKRAIRYGDGWIPIGGRGGELEEQIVEFRQMADDAGRPGLEVSLYGVSSKKKELETMKHWGVDRAVVFLPPNPAEDILPRLDRLAAVMEEIG